MTAAPVPGPRGVCAFALWSRCFLDRLAMQLPGRSSFGWFLLRFFSDMGYNRFAMLTDLRYNVPQRSHEFRQANNAWRHSFSHDVIAGHGRFVRSYLPGGGVDL